MRTHYDVIIIGAGPAGSCAAILLAEAGWSVALLEKQPFPRRKVCGECIAATNFDLIDALGIGAAFHRLAGPELRRLALMCDEKTIHAELPALDSEIHRWGKALGREHFDTLLLARAKEVGVTLWQPWSIRSIGGAPGHYRCEAACADSGYTASLTASVMIAAHGSWELAPGARGASRLPHRPSDLFAFKANFNGGNLANGLLSVLGFAGGYGGMVLGDHDVVTLACCVRRDALSAARQARQLPNAAAAVESLLKTCVGVREALGESRRDGSWLSIGPIRPGIRIRPGDTVFAVGNAAGEAHPIIGEGISMALQSAWLLCESLIAERAQLLDGSGYRRIQRAYYARWMRSFAPRIRLAALFAHCAMRPSALVCAMPLLRRWPSLLTHGARWSGKITQSYGPLPQDRPTGDLIQPIALPSDTGVTL